MAVLFQSPLLTFCILAMLAACLVCAMIAVGIMDVPDVRKAHGRPTPTAGGVGIVAAMLSAPLLLPALCTARSLVVLGAAALLGVIALADDMRERPVMFKLAAQVAAALAAMLVGIRIGPESWGIAGAMATVIWIVAVTNAVNFIDGVDGLAPGVALLVCLIVWMVAPAGGAAAALALGLAAGLAGFLPFNWPRARIFLGDAGSQPIGFLLACLGLLLPAAQGALLPLLLFGVLFDVGFTLVHRIGTGAPPTVAHRDHLYQRTNLSKPAIAALHWGFVIWGACCWRALNTTLAPAVPTLLLGPQLAWMVFVRRRLHRPNRV